MNKTVLVVDDNEINRKILRRILSADYSVVEAENGKEALDYLYANHTLVAAVLLDLSMPVMDGYEVLESIQADARLSQIPTIVTTGNTEKESERRALTLGATDFVAKPYDAEIIKRRLFNLIKLRETSALVNALQKDNLTGLWNRETFFEKAAWEIANKPEGHYYLASVDIDNFKVVNDQFGTEKGDEILKNLATKLKRICSAEGSLCGRISGDDFVLLYPARCKETVFKLTALEDTAISIVLSVGHYHVDDKTLNTAAMYDRAVIAQSTVKGRYDLHSAVYETSMRDRLLREQEITDSMRGALADGQFEAWFQPQYNHSTGALIGAEALARWRHPAQGLIPPMEFIPIFERNGFVYELDMFIWEEVCRHIRRWLDGGLEPLPVSVNISRYDLFREDLVDSICSLVEKYSLPVELLRLEITESAFANEPEHIVGVARRLIERGFTVEIDDFGSGYSSLNTLKDVPAQIVKLDMRFLETSDNLDRGGNILESIVRMSKWLGMSVIAEGVELLEQADFLKSIGCNYIQGYLYAKPMMAEEYEKLAEKTGKERQLSTIEAVENLDNNSFWSPRSMDTLIFNTYVGAAAIFEWHNDNIEVLRANEKFAKTILGENGTISDVLRIVWTDHAHGNTSETVKAAIARSIDTGSDVTFEAEYHDFPAEEGIFHLRTTVRPIARTGNRYLVYATAENVTAQRKAEARSMETAAQIQALIDNMDAGASAVVVENDKPRYLFLNDRYCKMFGYSRAEFLELPNGILSIAHPDDLPYMTSRIAYNEDAREIDTLEFRCLHRDGSTVWVRANVSARAFPNIESTIHISVIHDFTKERETQREILALNDTLVKMMNDMPGGFARIKLVDNAVITEYVNSRLCEMRGMSSKELIEKMSSHTYFDVHPEDWDALHTKVQLAIDTGETQRLSYRLLCGDGEYHSFSVFFRPTRGATDDMYVNLYYTEVSEREIKEQSAIEISALAFSTILASTTDMSFIKDKDFVYIACSLPFARMAGKNTVEEIIGKTDYELFEKSLADRFRSDDLTLFERGESLLNYIEPIAGGGDIQRYSSTSKYILRDSAGGIAGLYGAGRDVTEYRTDYEHLRLLTDSISGGLMTYVLTENGIRLVYFNDGICRLFGCTREQYEELSKENIMTAVFDEDRPKIQEQVQRTIAEGTPINCVYRVRYFGDDKKYKWVNLRVGAPELRGDRLYANAILFDITEQKLAEEDAKIREQEYRLAILDSGKLIYRYSHADNALEVPPETARLFDLPERIDNVPDGVIAKGSLHPDSIAAYRAFYDKVKRGDKTGSMTVFRRVSNGEWRWFEARFSNIFADDGKPVSAIIAVEDITSVRATHMEDELNINRYMTAISTVYPLLISINQTQDSYEIVLENEYISLIDKKRGTITELVTGAAALMEPEYAQDFLNRFGSEGILQTFAAAGDSVRLEYKQRTTEGELRWIEIIIIRTENEYNDDLTGVVVGRYIDAQKEMEDKLRLAVTDVMTGIYNKATTEELITAALAVPTGKTSALLIADLDNLKSINDTFGHAMGDKAIKLMTGLLSAQFRQTDIVGRVGGDEFVVFARDITRARITSTMFDFMRKLSTIRLADDIDARIRGSIGIAFGGDDETYEQLFKKADRALYHVKRNGKDNFAFYTPDMENEDFRYESVSDVSKWQAGMFNLEELDTLLKAISSIYPLVISVNLTQNSYYMLQYENFTTHAAMSSGVFDDLIDVGASSFHPDDRASFAQAFSRENMLAAHASGARSVVHIGKQLGDDNEYRTIRTEAIFVKARGSDDVLEISLAREIEER